MGQDVLRFVNYIVVLATLSRRRVLLRSQLHEFGLGL